MKKFVHLHGHSEYSLLDGLSKIKQLVKAVKEMEMPAVALTDHGAMYGAIEFYKECVKENIKPIIGCELYVAKRSHKDKEGRLDTEPYHLTVFARNYQGYLNLMKLVSVGHLDGYYYRPRVDRELLKEYHEGLVALSGCPAGEFIRNLREGNEKGAKEVAEVYQSIFGEENYFFELQNHEYDLILKNNQSLDPKVRRELEEMERLQRASWQTVKEFSKKLGIKVVATNDFHYVNPDDASAQDALVCVQTGKLIKDIDRLRMIDTPNLYIRSGDEMAELFSEFPDSIDNSIKIAERCNLELDLGKAKFLVFPTPNKESSDEYLRKLTFEGAKEKFKEMTKEIKERLEYELDIITYKKYADYFLVVADFMTWAHEHGIITNTRGSAAGSLALYCLGVTNLNPLDYLLPFERFLTKYRPTMPDIDADIADDRRDEIINYMMDKYGHDKVCHVVTFGTMMGRAAVRDIGRVLAVPYSEVDRIAKFVPPPHQGFHKPLPEAIKEVPELSQLYREDVQVKTLLDLAMRVEGTVRHASVHAAGILLAPDEMTKFTPLQREANGEKVVSQYDMFSMLDEYGGVGLVKIDLLGIRNLAILGKSVVFVEETHGIKVDINKLQLDDKKTYELLARGETMGIFQLSSDGMTRYLMELKPTSITDLSAMVALYRPGPLSVIPDYIARKNNPKLIKYFDPRMEEYMEQSLGLLVYQEDVLYTAINIAGYSWQEADKFRKAMGKKIPAEMAKQKDHFVGGCIKNGMTAEKAEELFALIAPFAAYGFNKAHAASYAIVSYQTAYMKANYPVEFMTAVMTAEYGDTEKIAAAMEECKKMGIVVLPPDVDKSGVGFTVENIEALSEKELDRQLTDLEEVKMKQAIRFGLSAIKNVGISAIESIIKARQKEPFKSLSDLCGRVDTRLVNRKTLESLIKSGALDNLGGRAAQLQVLDQCLEKAHQRSRAVSSGQVGLFGEQEPINEVEIKLPNVEELSLDQMLTFEKELLGFYLHEPPFQALLEQANAFCSHTVSGINEELVGKRVSLAAVVVNVKRVMTKKTAAEMAFVKFSDGISEIEGVIFPTTFAESKTFLENDKVVVVWGKVDKREDQLSLVIDKITLFDPENLDPAAFYKPPERSQGPRHAFAEKEVEITIPKSCGVEILQKVNKTLRGYPGKLKVAILLYNGGNNLKRMDLPFMVKAETVLIQEIEEILGKGSVRVVPVS